MRIVTLRDCPLDEIQRLKRYADWATQDTRGQHDVYIGSIHFVLHEPEILSLQEVLAILRDQ